MKSAARKPSPAWYALRRTLPVWSFEQNLRELVACLPRYRVDEVIVKVDTEEFTHGQPSLEWIQAYQPRLFRIQRALAKIGVAFSINPWITVGHCDRGRDVRPQLPGYRTVVGHDGTECTCCACPLSTVWRDHIRKLWTLYAETKPRVIWVEDDIRTFNHAPASFGCFCPDHMRLFSQRAGREVTREKLVAAMLQPGKPHPWRAIYLDMQAEFMVETVGFLAKVVHAVSPATALGLMSSGPAVHCLEGRRWKEFALAMGDGQPIFSRPPMGNYSEDSLRGFYYSHDSIKITRHCMPAGAIELTEVENVPFTQYSKSVAFTFVETALSVAYGSHGVSLNLFDHAGTPMESDPKLGQMLGTRKKHLNALAARCQAPGSYRGVQLLYHERASYMKRMPDQAWYGHLMGDGQVMMQALEGLGIPTTYDPAPVIAASGQTLRAFADDEIQRMLGGGLLLDAEAAGVLLERGFGPAIGLQDCPSPQHVDSLGALGAEEFHARPFGGAPRQFMTLTLPSLGRAVHISRIQPLAGAKVISDFVDPDARRRLPAMCAWQNDLGGRVVISALAFRTALGPAFYHPFRRRQLQGAVRWLAHGAPEVLINGGGVYPLAFRKETADGRTLLGLFNLALDPWDQVEFEITDRRRPLRLERLTLAGQWQKDHTLAVSQRGNQVLVRCHAPIPFDEPLFITVTWK